MRNERGESEYAELKQLISETKKIAEETRGYSKSVRNYVRWIQITSVLRLFLIAIPLALAFIYLPPVVRNFGEVYRNFFGGTSQSNILQQFLNTNEPNGEASVEGLLKGLQKK